MDPDSSNPDPDPAIWSNPDPDPDPRTQMNPDPTGSGSKNHKLKFILHKKKFFFQFLTKILKIDAEQEDVSANFKNFETFCWKFMRFFVKINDFYPNFISLDPDPYSNPDPDPRTANESGSGSTSLHKSATFSSGVNSRSVCRRPGQAFPEAKSVLFFG